MERRHNRHGLFASALLIVVVTTALSSLGAGIDVTTSNDILGNNAVDDDLYTGSLALDFTFDQHALRLEENLFTDRAAGQRFDETSLLLALPEQKLGAWTLRSSFGAMHVGSGLLGEEAQNALHDLLGDETVELDYPASNEFFGVAAFSVERTWAAGRDWFVTPELEIHSALGYKSHAEASIKSQLGIGKRFSLFTRLGYRATDSEYDILEPHIREADLAYEVSLGFNKTFYLSHSQNRFGVGQRHLRLYVRIDPSRKR